MKKICPSCQTENDEAFRFCENCGETLTLPPKKPTSDRPRTMLVAPPPKRPTPAPSPAEASPPRAAPRTQLLPDLTIKLSLLDGKVFVLTGKKEFGIGRTDPASHWYPAVDLAPHGGEPGGVSRRHGRITIEGASAYVEDNGSSNGTKLNGNRLTASQRYPLANGDEVEFGRIYAKVSVEDSRQ